MNGSPHQHHIMSLALFIYWLTHLLYAAILRKVIKIRYGQWNGLTAMISLALRNRNNNLRSHTYFSCKIGKLKTSAKVCTLDALCPSPFSFNFADLKLYIIGDGNSLIRLLCEVLKDRNDCDIVLEADQKADVLTISTSASGGFLESRHYLGNISSLARLEIDNFAASYNLLSIILNSNLISVAKNVSLRVNVDHVLSLQLMIDVMSSVYVELLVSNRSVSFDY